MGNHSGRVCSVDRNYERWYIQAEYRLGKQMWGSQWKLPEGLTCEHCVVSCSWYTAQHCSIPCDEALCGPKYSNRQNEFGRRGQNFRYKPCPLSLIHI